MSVVTGFHRYKKFNVRSIIEPPVSTKPSEKEADDKKTEAKVEEDAKDGEGESEVVAEDGADVKEDKE